MTCHKPNLVPKADAAESRNLRLNCPASVKREAASVYIDVVADILHTLQLIAVRGLYNLRSFRRCIISPPSASLPSFSKHRDQLIERIRPTVHVAYQDEIGKIAWTGRNSTLSQA